MAEQMMLLVILVASLALSVLIARALLELVLAGITSSQHRADGLESDVSVAGVHTT
jgi:hypothetical protein